MTITITDYKIKKRTNVSSSDIEQYMYSEQPEHTNSLYGDQNINKNGIVVYSANAYYDYPNATMRTMRGDAYGSHFVSPLIDNVAQYGFDKRVLLKSLASLHDETMDAVPSIASLHAYDPNYTAGLRTMRIGADSYVENSTTIANARVAFYQEEVKQYGFDKQLIAYTTNDSINSPMGIVALGTRQSASPDAILPIPVMNLGDTLNTSFRGVPTANWTGGVENFGFESRVAVSGSYALFSLRDGYGNSLTFEPPTSDYNDSEKTLNTRSLMYLDDGSSAFIKAQADNNKNLIISIRNSSGVEPTINNASYALGGQMALSVRAGIQAYTGSGLEPLRMEDGHTSGKGLQVFNSVGGTIQYMLDKQASVYDSTTDYASALNRIGVDSILRVFDGSANIRLRADPNKNLKIGWYSSSDVEQYGFASQVQITNHSARTVPFTYDGSGYNTLMADANKNLITTLKDADGDQVAISSEGAVSVCIAESDEVQTITHMEYHQHQGGVYMAGHLWYDDGSTNNELANGDEAVFVIETPSTGTIHFYPSIRGNGMVEIKFLEAVATYSGGTAITPPNTKRDSSNTFGGTVKYDSTYTTDGNTIQLGVDQIGDSSGGWSATISGGEVDDMWILKNSTKYVVVVKNMSAADVYVSQKHKLIVE